MSTGKTDLEAVECTWCRAQPGEACEFTSGPAPMVTDNGVQRRAVHAARYAGSLPQEERRQFWASAVERYMAHELERMNAAAPATPEREA